MRFLKVTDSDVIDAVGFAEDPDISPQSTWTAASSAVFGSLGVIFKASPDDVYVYAGVSSETFVKLVAADSIGKAFHELFRKNKYPFTKSARTSTLKK